MEEAGRGEQKKKRERIKDFQHTSIYDQALIFTRKSSSSYITVKMVEMDRRFFFFVRVQNPVSNNEDADDKHNIGK